MKIYVGIDLHSNNSFVALGKIEQIEQINQRVKDRLRRLYE